MADVLKPLFDVLGPHPGGSCHAALQQLAGGNQYLLVQWGVIIDFDLFDNNWERVTRLQPPHIQVNSLQSLMLHSVVARLHLHFRRGPIPSLQMVKGLLNIPPHEFRLDESSNPFRVGSAVPTK